MPMQPLNHVLYIAPNAAVERNVNGIILPPTKKNQVTGTVIRSNSSKAKAGDKVMWNRIGGVFDPEDGNPQLVIVYERDLIGVDREEPFPIEDEVKPVAPV